MGFKMSADRALTKDAIQTLFLELWEKRHQTNEVTHWNAYLRKSLYRKILVELKKKKSLTQDISDHNYSFFTPSYEELLIHSQTTQSQKDKLKSALKQLPLEERKVLNLRFFEGLSYEEIAENTGKSKQTVYNQIFSAISKLRKTLKY